MISKMSSHMPREFPRKPATRQTRFHFPYTCIIYIHFPILYLLSQKWRKFLVLMFYIAFSSSVFIKNFLPSTDFVQSSPVVGKVFKSLFLLPFGVIVIYSSMIFLVYICQIFCLFCSSALSFQICCLCFVYCNSSLVKIVEIVEIVGWKTQKDSIRNGKMCCW